MRLAPGLAMDLTTCDECGNAWGFNCEATRVTASLLIIASQMRAAFGRPQALNSNGLRPGSVMD
eukprot:9300855-Pyramimonas_sp.AAC.1